MVGLHREVFEDFLSSQREESTELLCVGPFNKELLIFEFGAVLGIVTHQVLTEVDAGVEPFPNVRVHRVRIVFVLCCDTSQFFNSGYEHWVQLLCQVDIVVLLAIGQLNYLALEFEQRLNECNLKVIREEIHVFVVLLALLVSKIGSFMFICHLFFDAYLN